MAEEVGAAGVIVGPQESEVSQGGASEVYSPRALLSSSSQTQRLTAILAERVMGWAVGPDRFMMGNRGWTPRWRFQPTENLVDAFRLLEEAAPQEFGICSGDKGRIHVSVRIGGNTGEADGTSKPHVITLAVARALGLEVDE